MIKISIKGNVIFVNRFDWDIEQCIVSFDPPFIMLKHIIIGTFMFNTYTCPGPGARAIIKHLGVGFQIMIY